MVSDRPLAWCMGGGTPRWRRCLHLYFPQQQCLLSAPGESPVASSSGSPCLHGSRPLNGSILLCKGRPPCCPKSQCLTCWIWTAHECPDCADFQLFFCILFAHAFLGSRCCYADTPPCMGLTRQVSGYPLPSRPSWIRRCRCIAADGVGELQASFSLEGTAVLRSDGGLALQALLREIPDRGSFPAFPPPGYSKVRIRCYRGGLECPYRYSCLLEVFRPDPIARGRRYSK